MSLQKRLQKLKQKIICSLVDCIDIHFMDAGKVTGIRRLWINSDKPDEEFTLEHQQ